MYLKIKLALTYLYSNRVSNLIAFLGIVIGLFSLIVVSSVSSGLSKDMARRIVSTKGEIRVYHKDFSPILDYNTLIDSLVNKYPQIVIGSPINRDDLLIRKRHYTAYTETFGIDFAKHKEISDILDMMVIGHPEEERFKTNGIMIGLEVAYSLIATVGDTVEVISPAVMTPTALGMIPKTERFRVVGIFATGLPEFDRLYTFIDIDNSKVFKRHNGADYIEIKTNITNYKYNKLIKQIESDFPELIAQHWEIFDKTLFQAIKVERIALFVVMAIIIVLASFNITGNFIRTVTEKKSEIAILKTLGLSKDNIFGFFVIMGLIVCIAGILIAVILSYTLLYLQLTYQFISIPVPGFPFTAVPVDISLWQFFAYSLLTLFICLIGTLYPASKTMKIDIIDILKE